MAEWDWGPGVNHWQAFQQGYMNTASDKCTFYYAAGMQSLAWGFNLSSGVTVSLNVNGTTKSASGGFYSASGATTQKQFVSNDGVSVSRGHSAKTITVSTTVTNASGYMNGTSSCSHTWTVPARPSYTVSFNANGGSGAPGNQTKWYGETLTLSSTKPTRSGYTFKGWATSSSGSVAYAAGGSYTGNSALTLYAVWQVNTWTLTFNSNGGTSCAAISANLGSSITLPTPTRSGYTLKGWSIGSESTTLYKAGSAVTFNSNLTMYAAWTANTYTVSYNANGGSGAPGNQTKTTDIKLTLSSTKPTRAGYTFKGWATSASGSVAYAAGGNYTANAAVTLYAVWQINSYTITFNGNGGSGSSKTGNYNSTFTVPTPTRTGYDFKGWGTSASATSAAYAAGATYKITGSATLYAIWSKHIYKVAFNANGGTNSSTTSANVVYQASLKLTSTYSCTRALYAFAGWATSANGSVAYKQDATYAQNEAKDVTLYAVWQNVYNKPIISNVSAARYSDSACTAQTDEGTYVKLTFDWFVCKSTDSVGNTWKSSKVQAEVNSSIIAADAGAQSGTYSKVFSDLSAEKTFTGTITVTDVSSETGASQSSTASFTAAMADYPIDASPNGGVAIGGVAADSSRFDMNKAAYANKGLTASAITTTGNITYYDSTNNYNGGGIKFYKGGAYGSGVGIGAGGTTIIGGGESAATMADTVSNKDLESMYVCNDGNIDFYANCQNGASSAVHSYLDTSNGFHTGGVFCTSITNTGNATTNGVYTNFVATKEYNSGTGAEFIIHAVNSATKRHRWCFTQEGNIKHEVSTDSGSTWTADGWYVRDTKHADTTLNCVYPVGAVYISYVSTSPASLFGGSWTQITGRFLRAANDVSTGGSDSKSHTHTYGLRHKTARGAIPNNTNSDAQFEYYNNGNWGTESNINSGQNGRLDTGYVTAWTSATSYARLGFTASTSSASVDVKPAYQDLYVWRRTA